MCEGKQRVSNVLVFQDGLQAFNHSVVQVPSLLLLLFFLYKLLCLQSQLGRKDKDKRVTNVKYV